MGHVDRPLVGISLAALAMLFFSTYYAFFKACTPYMTNFQMVFIQNILSWGLVLPFVLRQKKGFLKTELSRYIGLRTIFGLLALISITFALRTGNLAEVVLLNNTAPLFIPLILLIWHREKITLSLGLSILVGFIGVFIVFHPGFRSLDVGMLLAILSGLFSALLLVVTRMIAGEPLLRLLFYYYLLFWVLVSPFAIINWQPVSLFVWMMLILAAVVAIGAQLAFTMALRFAHSKEVAPFIYTSVIFSAIIGWLFFDEKIGLISCLGMLVVIVGGVMTIISARQRRV